MALDFALLSQNLRSRMAHFYAAFSPLLCPVFQQLITLADLNSLTHLLALSFAKIGCLKLPHQGRSQNFRMGGGVEI